MAKKMLRLLIIVIALASLFVSCDDEDTIVAACATNSPAKAQYLCSCAFTGASKPEICVALTGQATNSMCCCMRK
jgi:hypothetical protein